MSDFGVYPDLAVIASGLLAVGGIIFLLRKSHPQEIYMTWYVFSLFFLVFGAITILTIKSRVELTDVFGPSQAHLLKTLYGYLTDYEGEMVLVAVFFGIAVAPQLVTYVLSGLSGSAKTPKYVRQVTDLATLSLLKFLAGAAGIFIGQGVGKFTMGQTDYNPLGQDMYDNFAFGLLMLSQAFSVLIMHVIFFDLRDNAYFRKRELLGWKLLTPSAKKVHAFFTRHSLK
ncbi:hypothetical protein [Bradyrhizobium oligotrophicum]|uniref:hypothetical protein n=1 Tax=Bradyrhizobium oligotrophicum TaxID=44255 RepID=UPI003EBA9209